MILHLKIRCNGPEHHVNEIDVNKLLQDTVVLRHSAPPPAPSPEMPALREKYIARCRECTHDVVITKAVLQEFLSAQNQASS